MQFGKRCFLAVAALLIVAMPMFAQTLGSLTGTVTFDNAPLPGATVTILNTGTGLNRYGAGKVHRTARHGDAVRAIGHGNRSG